MPTIRLVASTYTRSNTSYVTVTDPENMYYNTDHSDSYCTLRGRTRNTTTYYAYIRGFNISDVPANATVTGFSIKIKAYRGQYQSDSTTYRARLASQPDNDHVISNTILDDVFSTTEGGQVYTFPNGALTWNDIVSYGSDFSIQIRLRNSSTSSGRYPYVYVYGAEIAVTYTLPHTVSVTSSVPAIHVHNTTDFSHTYTVADGADLNIECPGDFTGATVTDNGNDITSTLTNLGNDGKVIPLTNIQEDHTILIFIPSPTGNTIYIKVNGQWKEASDVYVKVNGQWKSVDSVYKKVNGSWSQQTDKSAMFDQNALYVSGN